MKFIIFTKEQGELIRGEYGKYSGIDPIQVFRKENEVEIEEYALPLECLNDPDLIQIRGFLMCFPQVDAAYYIKQPDIITGEVSNVYL